MKKLVLIFAAIMLMANMNPDTHIKGKVNDVKKNPISDVTVLVKGSKTTTTTDAYGNFSIPVPEHATLVFKHPGYVPVEMPVGADGNYTITMLHVQSDTVTTELKKEEKSKHLFVSSVVESYDAVYESEGVSMARSAKMAPSAYYNGTPDQDFNTEGYSAIHENGFKSPVKEPVSTFSIDVDAASYSNVRRFITMGQKPVPDAVRIEEMINYFDYDYPQPTGDHPFSIIYELGECPWNVENKLLHIGLQGEKMKNEDVPASNLVFLIDVSGSMDEPNKLPLLVNAMKLLVGQLRQQDRVAMVVYAGNSGLVLPSTSGNQKDKIINALERLQAGGSTAGAEGLELAYKTAAEHFIEKGNNRIILATDGDFNIGPSSNAEMERLIENYRNKGIFISVAGFGMGNYKDDKMEIIADKGNGNYSYIDNLMEAKKVFVNEFSSTLYTIAKDVKIQIEFNPAYVKEYRLVGYENRLLNEEDFDNDKKDAGEMGAGHTVTALYEIVPAAKGKIEERDLRYQTTQVLPDASGNNELASIKFRYKRPDGDKSILMTEIIPHQSLPISQTSENFRFSAAVAGFGMLLRNSEFKGTMNYERVLLLARNARGEDKDGYRSEFIRLVELSETGLALAE